MAVKKNKEERRQFFEELLEKCHEEETYSVIELSEQLGVEYKLVESWARKNSQLNEMLQECRSLCAKRAKEKQFEYVRAGDKNEEKKYVRYQLENDDEFVKEMKELQLEYEREKTKEEEQRQIQKERRKSITLNLWGRPKKEGLNLEDSHVPAKFNHIEETRISTWESKSKTDSVPFVFKKNNEESTEEITKIDAHFINENLTMPDQVKIARANLCAATGTGGDKAGLAILSSTMSAMPINATGDHASTIQVTQEALTSMKPNDIFEGMLCSKLLILHNHAMDYMSHASNPDAKLQTQEMYLNRAIKIMRLHNETQEALNKHRRKGEQKVVVVHQNVQVNDGGQALVAGELAQGVGGKDKKTKE